MLLALKIMVKVTFKYDYTLLESGKITTFKAGDSQEFPDESPLLEVFNQQRDILTIEKQVKKQPKKTK